MSDLAASRVEWTSERLRKGAAALALVAVMLLAGLVVLARPAAATVTAGATTALVNSGQPTRESSTAVPVFAINATGTSGADLLTSITVQFSGTGFVAGNGGSLLALDTNPARSGVALYRDSGSLGFALDATDAGVTATAVVWTTNNAVLSFAEPVPLSLSGRFGWILVIRTSAAVSTGNQIIAQIPAGGVTFTGTVSQPASALAANTLTVSATVAGDLLAPGTWIGTPSDSVNARAVLSVAIVDGGISVNYGIHDQLHRLIVQLFDNSGTFGANKLAPLSTNPATSGAALYADTNGNGVWDAGDLGVVLSATPAVDCVGPSGGALLDVCLLPSTAFLPHSLSGAAVSYFVVARSGTAMASGDDFSFQILQANGLWISGVSPDDATRNAGTTDVLSSSLLGDDTPPCIQPICGSPMEPHWANPSGSPYVYPVGHTLYFSHQMGATPVVGSARLAAADGGSGLGQAVFSAEPSLAGSPAAQPLSGTGVFVNVAGDYLFNATSTAASSPAFVTVYDAVGNHASFAFSFVLDTTPPTITPAPGWTNLPGGQPFYVNATGVLWFSPWIAGTAPVDLAQNLFDGGAGLHNATGSVEPSLAGGPVYVNPSTFGAGTFFFGGWTVEYDFSGASSGASSPAVVTACDNVGNCASVSYAYVLDAGIPQVTILAPVNGASVSGSIIVAATAADSGSGIAPPLQVGLMNAAGAYVLGPSSMFWNGTAWRFPVQTALYADGPYRIVVMAMDNVGNVGAAVADVTFHNSALDTTPPSLAVTTPSPYAYLSGTVNVKVVSADAGGFGSSGGVWAQLGAYAPIALTPSGSNWTGSLNTVGVPDGVYTLTIWSTDAAGNTARTSFQVTVDNTPPAVAFAAPGSNALASGILVVRVSALDAVGVGAVALAAGASNVTMASIGSGVYEYYLDTTGLTTGSVTLTATAVDLAGLSTSRSLVIRVDNAAPSVTLASPSGTTGAITMSATVTDSPAGVASVLFIVDGKTYTGVSQGGNVYAVTIWTTAADNGAHSYEVVATDRAGNTATSSSVFNVNNPTDYYAAFLAFAPLGIFVVLLVALILGLLLLLRRRKKPEAAMPESVPEPPKPEEEI